MSRREKRDEDGALLLILMVGVAVMSIGLGVAAQAWSSTWRRDNEEELIFRGEQYVNAILAYRKEHNGQFPVDLTELMKEGPRRLRYIRKLYRDPINPSGQWGLLYLMPGGQGIYDPVAAQKQQNTESAADDDGTGEKAPSRVMTSFPGVTPISFDPSGTGVANPAGIPGAPGMSGGMMPGGGAPGGGIRPGVSGGIQDIAALPRPGGGIAGGGSMAGPPPKPATGTFDDDSPSEPPIGWPIVGVISRASDSLSAKTYKVYRGHEGVNEWQFHVFDHGAQLGQAPAGTTQGGGVQPIGPGFGGGGSSFGIGTGSNLNGGRPGGPYGNWGGGGGGGMGGGPGGGPQQKPQTPGGPGQTGKPNQ